MGAAREAQAVWTQVRTRRRTEEFEAAVADGEALRKHMLHACSWNLRCNRKARKALEFVREGNGHADLAQDLHDLAGLVENNLPAFDQDDTFDAAAVAKQARQVSKALMGESAAYRHRFSHAEAKDTRDRAFTYLDDLVEELREAGRYVYRDDEAMAGRFTSNTGGATTPTTCSTPSRASLFGRTSRSTPTPTPNRCPPKGEPAHLQRLPAHLQRLPARRGQRRSRRPRTERAPTRTATACVGVLAQCPQTPPKLSTRLDLRYNRAADLPIGLDLSILARGRMTVRNFRIVRWLCAGAFLMALGAPSAAFAADECSSDADCDEGFSCETSQAPCAAIDCAEGTDCSTECEPTTISECQPEPPASCATAAECGDGEVCVTLTYEECSGTVAACAPGEECDADAQADTGCATRTEGYCLPPYLAPCQTSSDCGQGFECVESEVCECSGGGSTGGISTDGTASDGDGSTTDSGISETECTCSPTGDYYCELVEQECTSDADCAGDLICDEPPFGQDGEMTVCVSSPDGGSECDVDAGISSDSTMYCQPEDLERWVGAADHVYGGTSYDESNGGTSGGSQSDGREVVSSEVDRGGGASSGGGSGSEGAGCASTGLGGSPSGPLSNTAGGAFGFMMLVAFGVFGVRRRR